MNWDLTAKPSKVQVNFGGGLAVATHISETAGPGCSVCSMKLFSITGGASESTKHKLLDKLSSKEPKLHATIWSRESFLRNKQITHLMLKKVAKQNSTSF